VERNYQHQIKNKRPFFFLFIPFSIGIILSKLVIPRPILWQYLLLLAILLATGTFVFHNRRMVSAFTVVFVFVLGIIITSISLARNDNRIIIAESINPPVKCSFTAVLLDDPLLVGPLYDVKEQSSVRISVRAYIENVEINGKVQDLNIPAVLHLIINAEMDYFCGDRVKCEGILQRPSPKCNPGGFDNALWLSQQGIFLEATVRSATDVSLIQRDCGSRLRRLMWRTRSKLRESLFAGKLSDNNRAFLIGMTIGEKYLVTNEMQEVLMNTNSIHILVVSGLNVTILAGAVFLLLRAIPIRRNVRVLIAIAVILLYVALLDFPAPAVRAAIMSSAFLIAPIFKRESDMLNTLGFSAFVSLLFRPLDLFSASFQLSMLIVYSLIMLAVPITGYCVEKFNLAPDRGFFAIGRPSAVLRSLFRYFVGLFAASFAAFIGSLPLVAWYFNIVNPLSILSNTIIIPFTAIITPLGLLSSVGGLIWHSISALMNCINAFFISIMTAVIGLFSEASFSVVHIMAPPLLHVIGFYFLLGIAGFSVSFSRSVRFLLLSLFTLSAIFIPLYGVIIRDDCPELTILDIKSCGVQFLLFPDGRSVLINTGSERDASRIIHPFLKSRGINRLDVLILSSTQEEFAGGINYIVERYKIGEVYLPTSNEPGDTRLFMFLKEQGIGVASVPLGGEYVLENAGNLTIHAFPGKEKEIEDGSPYLAVKYNISGITAILFNGISFNDYKALLEDVPADTRLVVVADTNSMPVIKKTSVRYKPLPQLIILCGKDDSVFKGIELNSLDLQSADSRLISIAKQGAVFIKFLQNKFEVRTMLP
jgi:competence protein ComEC